VKGASMTVNASPLPPSALERVLARDRRLTAVALAALVALAWGYLLVLSGQMNDTSMSGMASMPGMAGMQGSLRGDAAAGSTESAALTVLMWWTMMIGMMVPSAAPMVLLFGNVQRRQLAAESPKLRVALFTAGYLAAWGAFSALAAGAQIALTRLALLAPMELTVATWLGALLVALAGVYQLTPLKNVCLRRCRSPAEFLSSHWRRGSGGAFRMGVEHGLYCVGCCWLLMGLLFVVGVMNLLWVAAIAAFVLIEKLVPHGETTAEIGGVALLLLAAYLAFIA
jgi:predicted metal-binding membrane protein